MRILVRADSSAQIGTGHIMRILTLLNQLESQFTAEFVCYPFEGNMIDFIKNKGYRAHIMPYKINSSHILDDHSRLDDYQYVKEHIEEDMAFTQNILSQNDYDIFLIDHYMLNKDYELHFKYLPIFVIDDYIDREHECSVLFNQNYNHNIEMICTNSIADIKLLGQNYSLLREEFLFYESFDHKLELTSFSNILVTFGGTDPTNETEKILKMIHKYDLSRYHFNIVIGNIYLQNHPYIIKIYDHPNITFHVQTDRMAQLMHDNDIAIGAGGSTGLERMYMMLPTMTIAVHSNQVPFAESMDEAELGWHLGVSEDVTVEKIYEQFQAIGSNKGHIQEILQRLYNAMDRKKVRDKHLAKYLMKYSEVG